MSADLRPLEPGTPVQRELQADDSHTYEVTLAADQCYQAIVEQRGINVVMKVVDPNGKGLTELDDARGKEGSESVTFISELAGRYHFEIRAAEKSASSGRYQIRIAALRAPTAEDRELEKARRLLEESRSLRKKGNYDQALPLAERVLEIREKILGRMIWRWPKRAMNVHVHTKRVMGCPSAMAGASANPHAAHRRVAIYPE